MVLVNTNPFKSMEVEKEGNTLRIDEGMNIEFATELGEQIKGRLSKIVNKGKDGCKTELRVVPANSMKEDVSHVDVIAEGSLRIIADDESEDEE